MKQLTCEMCGSTELIKQDGFFVCQTCGTKYSVEEAKKLMVEGTVKVDNSDRIKNYLELARTAKDEDDSTTAAKYYALILEEMPNSWVKSVSTAGKTSSWVCAASSSVFLSP